MASGRASVIGLDLLIELVTQIDAAVVTAGPADVQLAEWADLLKANRALAVELKQRQEASDHIEGTVTVGGKRPETRTSHSAQPLDEHRCLFPDRHQRLVQVADGDRRWLPRRQCPSRECRELHWSQSEDQLRQEGRERLLEGHDPRMAVGLLSQPRSEDRRDLLVGLVLKQSREEQVACLEQREIFVVLDLPARQQPGGFEVKQGGCDEEKLADLAQIPLRPMSLDKGDELVGDPGECDFGDVELVLGDQAQQQVEGPLEHVEMHLEPGGRSASAGGLLYVHLVSGHALNLVSLATNSLPRHTSA